MSTQSIKQGVATVGTAIAAVGLVLLGIVLLWSDVGSLARVSFFLIGIVLTLITCLLLTPTKSGKVGDTTVVHRKPIRWPATLIVYALSLYAFARAADFISSPLLVRGAGIASIILAVVLIYGIVPKKDVQKD